MTRYSVEFENNMIRYVRFTDKNREEICMERRLPYDYRVEAGSENTYTWYIAEVTDEFIEKIIEDGTDLYYWWNSYMEWCVRKSIVPVDDILEVVYKVSNNDWYKSNLVQEAYMNKTV